MVLNIIYIFISIALYALSFPMWNLWCFSFVALTPFFFVIDRSKSLPGKIFYGILWGAAHSCAMGYWVFFTTFHHYEVPFAKSVLFFTLCLVVPVVLIYLGFVVLYAFFYRNHLFFYALVIPSLWVLAEYVKSALSFLLPWGGFDSALLGFSSFVQTADLIGGYGLIFIVVGINALLVYELKQFYCFQGAGIEPPGGPRAENFFFQKGMPLILILALVLLPVLYGAFSVKIVDGWVCQAYQNGQSVDVTLVQGNFSTKERWSGMGFYHRLTDYLGMSEKINKVPSHADDKNQGLDRVIIWPETTLNASSKVTDALFVELMRYIGKNALLISGGLKTDPSTNGVFNCAYFISGSGRLLRYDKHILLPYAETSPLVDLLDTYYRAPSEFMAGQTPSCIDAPGGKVGASICFEILYSGFIRESVKAGAEYLVNISNDSWFGDSPMPYIHLNAARLRAIENRRFLLRTSNSGISAIIAPTGHVTAKSSLFTKERIDGDFVKLHQLSFYARYGNLIIPGAVLILFMALLQVLLRKEESSP